MTSIFDTFKLRAEAVSAEVQRFPHKKAALNFIVDYLKQAGRVPGLSFEVTRERAAASKVGISQLDWAMANTGSLIQDAAPVDRRLVSTLPNIHIAIVETNRLLPDMPAVFSKIRPEQTNYISFITGPSRTADIERVLTIGVHGPEKLIIVFVDDMAGVN
jgi:L-lactate dehydrogenase complex protein LldG